MTNEGVRALQVALNRCYNAGLATDSVFGAATKAAVKSVQRAEGLNQDGVYGQMTSTYMYWPVYEANQSTFAGCHSYQHNP